MVKVFIVTKQWVNYDGWGISDPSIEGAFSTKEKAQQFIFDQTGDEKALKYGWSDHKSNNWFIREQELDGEGA